MLHNSQYKLLVQPKDVDLINVRCTYYIVFINVGGRIVSIKWLQWYAELDQNINIKYNFTPLAYWRLCESSGRVLQHLNHWSCRSCSGIRLHFNSLTSQAHSLITSLSSSQLSQLIIISNAQTEIKTFRSASWSKICIDCSLGSDLESCKDR